MIDEQTVARIASLAKLAVAPDEIATYTKDLNEVFTLVEQMRAVDVTDVTPMAHPLTGTQRLRDDVVTESNQREAMQACAPKVRDGLYVVPKVIE